MKPSDATWVLVGCGYTATRLARRLLAEGTRVIATRRTDEGAALSGEELGPEAEVRVADLLLPATLEGLVPPGAIVVHTAPPAPVPAQVAAEQHLIHAAAGARRLIYVSSTGVYGRGTGGWIDEDADPSPTGPIGARLLEAERVLEDSARRAGLEMITLRAAAIYGPHRGSHVSIAAGSHRIPEGAGRVSRIHVDDLGAAIVAAAMAPRLEHRVFNVADDEPTLAREFADAVAEVLGVPPPPTVTPDASSAASRELLGGDRRIRNRRLVEELGVRLSYPTWREGLRHALAEEERHGRARG